MKKSSKKQEVTPEVPTELKLAINKAAQEYMKNSFQQEVEGWDKWWAYCRPSHRHIGSLSKITFEVGKKEVTETELLEKIKANITKRLIEGESHFTSGFRSFSENDAFYQIEQDREYLVNKILDSSELLSELEKYTESPAINELFQRTKDYQHNLLAHDALRESIHQFSKNNRGQHGNI